MLAAKLQCAMDILMPEQGWGFLKEYITGSAGILGICCVINTVHHTSKLFSRKSLSKLFHDETMLANMGFHCETVLFGLGLFY